MLVPNLKGAQAALDSGADAMLLPLSASHAHSLANLRKTPDEVVAEIGRIRAERDASGSRCLLEVGMSTAFGCTIQGRVDEAEVLRLLQAVLDAGVDRVGLADTVGYADPLQVTRLFEQGFDVAGDAPGLRPLPRHARPGPGQRLSPPGRSACAASTPAWPASAAARTRRAPAATSPPRTWPTCSPAWACPPAWTSTRLIALRARVAQWLDGETLHGTHLARRPAEDDEGSRMNAPQPLKGLQPQVSAPQPLAGLRVVEFTHMVMGPTCGMVLADMGAEVIKVEPIDGDRTRRLLGAGAGFFPMFNRNKKSIGIDLQQPDGAAVARRLAASADVVAENFKPGTMEQVRPRLRRAVGSQPAADLRQPQGLPARAPTSTAPRSTRWCR